VAVRDETRLGDLLQKLFFDRELWPLIGWMDRLRLGRLKTFLVVAIEHLDVSQS